MSSLEIFVCAQFVKFCFQQQHIYFRKHGALTATYRTTICSISMEPTGNFTGGKDTAPGSARITNPVYLVIIRLVLSRNKLNSRKLCL